MRNPSVRIDYIGPQDSVTECVICGSPLDGRKLTCSPECYREFRTVKYLGLMHTLDGISDYIEDRKFRSRLNTKNSLVRVCNSCGNQFLAYKEVTCKDCRKREEDTQRQRNKEIIQSRKRPPTLEFLSKSRLAALGINHWTELPMQELYNCKQIDRTHYRITKFDKHLDPKYSPKGEQSSYIVSEKGCDCPAGNAPTCRHRKMLPIFADHGYIDTEYFFVWDTHQWYKPTTGVYAQMMVRPEDDVEPRTDIEPFEMFPQEGGQLPVSEVPSPQPSRTFRRF